MRKPLFIVVVMFFMLMFTLSVPVAERGVKAQGQTLQENVTRGISETMSGLSSV